MKWVRRVHLYLSCFFAPLFLFYVATGWYQSVSVNRAKGLGEGEDWKSKMTAVHVDLIYPADKAEGFSTSLYQILVVAMCVALIVSIILGLYLAFKTLRPRWILWLVLVLGVGIPVMALRLGLSY